MHPSAEPASAIALRDAEAAVELVYSDRAEARRLAESARERDGSPEVVAVTEHALGLVALSSGNLALATDHFRHAITVAREAGLEHRAAVVSGTLGYTLTLTGDTDEALATVDAALPLLDGLPGVRLRMQRALILTEVGRFDDAAGDFTLALELLRRDRSDGSEVLEGDIHTNRSILRYRMHDWRGAEADLARAEASYRATGHLGRIATVAHNRGAAAVIRGDLPAAFAYYDEAEHGYRAQGRDAGLLPVDRAEALLSVRLVAEARDAAAGAVEEYIRQRNAVDLVQARVVLAQAALIAGDPAAAREAARLATTAAMRQRRLGWAARANYIGLRARWEAGEQGVSMLRFGQRSVARLDRAGWVIAALEARLIVARLALDLGRMTVARQVLEEGARARSNGPAELRARAWHAEALLRQSTGDTAGAEAALAAGMDVLDQFRASLGASELRAHVSSSAGDLARMGLELALQSGRPASVLGWAESWRAGAMRVRPARPPHDADLALDLAALRQVVGETTSAAAEGRDVQPLLARQAVLENAIRARARHAPGSERSTATAATTSTAAAVAPDADDLHEALGPQPLVEYVVTSDELAAVVLAGGRTELHHLGPRAPIEQAVRALRYGLRRIAYGAGADSSLAAAEQLVDRHARALDELLLRPLGSAVAGGPRPLVVVPTGELHTIPWAALPSTAARPVSLAPSAALWYRATVGRAPGHQSPADPASPANRVVLAAGPELPHAQAEIDALARRYDTAARFTGAAATVDAVTAALDGADLVHIAAHGHFRADNPLFSSLQLADGPLTVYDLERLEHPPLDVVLSACDSGLPSIHAGDELLGLAAALLAMGTRCLIATLLPVPDDTTRTLMLRLHHHLGLGASPAAALAAAQADLVHEGSARDRIAAASFACFGAG